MESLPFDEDCFDRVIATHLPHHLNNPIEVLSEIKRVLKRGGTASILLPCDSSLAYRFSKFVAVSRLCKKANISNPRYFHYIQHKNHYPALEQFIRDVFVNYEIKFEYWPFIVSTWNFNLFVTIQIKKSD